MDYRTEFSDFEDVSYLNTATQGPMPLAASRAVQAALEWKKLPHRLPDDVYFGLPDRIRGLLAELLGSEPEEFAITSGASTGTNIVASQFDWKPDDEVLISEGEFPSHYAAFMPLEDAGQISVKIVRPRERFVTAEDFISRFSRQTRMVSVSLVRSNDGSRLDAVRLADACRNAGIAMLLDVSQCACAIPMNLHELGADFVVSSGYKWLLSPYGTGFFWVREDSMELLRPGPIYWMAFEGARDFHSLALEKFVPVPGARRWDAAETANFINLAAMEKSLEFLKRAGVETVAKHNERLAQMLIERLPRDTCMLASPTEAERRGPSICFSARSLEKTEELYKRLQDAKVIVSLRVGAIRVSPHLYNTERDISQLISAISA